jgi:thiol-disulfide isomerase/thioredoxin
MNTNKVKKIMKLSTSWCAPCRVYASTFHKVKEMDEYKDIEFKEIDIENDEDGEILAEKFQVRSVPTTILLDENDELIYKVMGNIPQKDLTNLINEALKDR